MSAARRHRRSRSARRPAERARRRADGDQGRVHPARARRRASVASRSRASSTRRRVPQMADAEDVLRALGPPPRRRALHRPRAEPQGLRARGGRRLQRESAWRSWPATPSTAATRASRPTSRSPRGSTSRARPRRAGMRAQVTVSARVRLPVRGRDRRWSASSRSRERVAEARPFEIALADTIGVGVPTQVTELVARVREAVPGIPLRCHFHNTRNTGFANVLRRAAGRRAHVRRQPRRHRRLSVRAGRDRQHRDRRPALPAAPHRASPPAFRSTRRSRRPSGCRNNSGAPCPACWPRPADFRGRRRAAA